MTQLFDYDGENGNGEGSMPPDVEIGSPFVPRRPYSFSLGDQRFFDREEAIEVANRRSRERGSRQSVRLSGPATLNGKRLWLVQDI